MSFLPGPKIGGINILTGAGSKITDPLGLFKEPAAPPPPMEATWGQPWKGNDKSGAATRAAAAAAGTKPASLEPSPKPTTGVNDDETLGDVGASA